MTTLWMPFRQPLGNADRRIRPVSLRPLVKEEGNTKMMKAVFLVTHVFFSSRSVTFVLFLFCIARSEGIQLVEIRQPSTLGC